MNSAGSVEGRERLRLFVALRLPDETVSRLADWQQLVLAATRARPVPRENLHVTVAFLGPRPAAELEPVAAVLRDIRVVRPPLLAVAGYRETRSVGMLVLEDEGGRAGALAGDVFARLEQLGVYRREARRWLPHVTVLRFRERPRLRPALPELGPVSPSDLALYHSVLRPTGAQYEVVESVALGG